jgi:hypothetical protein
MSRPKITLSIDGPILPGCISTARSTCGKPNCACKDKRRPKLHGTYYRWTGIIDGKRTTKTISKESALECSRRIRNYRRLQHKLEKLIEKSLKNAPWNNVIKTK